jgi:P-type Cu+ transporter
MLLILCLHFPGIVYMTLVKDSDPNQHYLMEPIWAGNVSRSEWALFFMATPVMFYSAYVFHRRSIKEIRALWRRGSTTPIWRRFVRFGSMNLLVSLGVSVAYFASVALLALAAVQPPSMEGEKVTYFDSVVFLTMFLLAGKFFGQYACPQVAKHTPYRPLS